MTEEKLYKALLTATKVAEVEDLIYGFERAQGHNVRWVPFGNLENNRGPIEVSTDPGRSLVERITNAIDAILEAEFESHNGIPSCRTPKDAAIAWLNVSPSGLSDLSPQQRRSIANRIKVKILPGDGRDLRIVEIRDFGIGLTPDQMPNSILSLNSSNKVQKHYLAGVYGQGGSSTFASSKYTLIASRHHYQKVGFTLVYYMDLPPEHYKTGHYVYLTMNGEVLEVELTNDEFPSGTLVKHFGYDLNLYPSPIGPGSTYGLLNTILFDPVLPVWLEDNVHKTPIHRVIKGSRNALNGAVDEGDEDRRGPKLTHNMKMFFVDLGDCGRIGIEYWVLERPTKENKEPTRSYVNHQKPIILTLNGQNHAELSRLFLRKNADLPYLTNRIICHIDCNFLTPFAKRALIASSREEARRGLVLELIQHELIRALKSDDELIRLNREAKENILRERDESAERQMRREVTRLLRIQGLDVVETLGGETSKDKKDIERPTHPRRGRARLEPIELHEPPTYIRIIWEENEPITFYPEQRRYIRIETDANSHYHNPQNLTASRINIIPTNGILVFRGSTPLLGGRMRAIFEALSESNIEENGTIRVELNRPLLPTLYDDRPFLIVEPPPVHSTSKRISLPPFEVRSVSPEDQLWDDLGWPDNVNIVASSTETENGKLIIYFSTAFPHFANRHAILEGREPALANSFTERYKIWLAVHSLILFQDQQLSEAIESSEAKRSTEMEAEMLEEYERKERCRIAALSVLFADRELHFPSSFTESD